MEGGSDSFVYGRFAGERGAGGASGTGGAGLSLWEVDLGSRAGNQDLLGIALCLPGRDAHLASPVTDRNARQVARPLLALRVRLTGSAAPIHAKVAFAPLPGRDDIEIVCRRFWGTGYTCLAVVPVPKLRDVRAHAAITEQTLAVCIFVAR
jgi:hypothetical protein